MILRNNCPVRGLNWIVRDARGTSNWTYDKDGTVNRLGGQITLKRLVDSDTVDVGIIDKPNNLAREQLGIIGRIEVRLGGFGRVQLETLADTFAENVQRGIGLHDLGHRLLQERLHTRVIDTVTAVQVVGEIDGNEHTGR